MAWVDRAKRAPPSIILTLSLSRNMAVRFRRDNSTFLKARDYLLRGRHRCFNTKQENCHVFQVVFINCSFYLEKNNKLNKICKKIWIYSAIWKFKTFERLFESDPLNCKGNLFDNLPEKCIPGEKVSLGFSCVEWIIVLIRSKTLLIQWQCYMRFCWKRFSMAFRATVNYSPGLVRYEFLIFFFGFYIKYYNNNEIWNPIYLNNYILNFNRRLWFGLIKVLSFWFLTQCPFQLYVNLNNHNIEI